LTAINCVLAVFTFKVVVAFWIFQSSGSILQAITGSLQVLVLSALLGAAFGILLPLVLRELGSLARDATIAFAFAVIALVALTHVAKLSPILATLSFGLMARHRRVTLNQAQRNFGALGDMLTVMLFLCSINTGMVTRLGWCRSGYSAGLRPSADKSRRQYGVCPRQRNHLSQRSTDGSGAVTHFGFCHSDAGTNTLSGYRFGR
jgi:Kef-type K+ transport system membrane component KefB